MGSRLGFSRGISLRASTRGFIRLARGTLETSVSSLAAIEAKVVVHASLTLDLRDRAATHGVDLHRDDVV